MPFHEGYKEALRQADASNREEMLDWMDSLYGTDNLSIRATDNEIRAELKNQVAQDFRYETDSSRFASDLYKAMHST